MNISSKTLKTTISPEVMHFYTCFFCPLYLQASRTVIVTCFCFIYWWIVRRHCIQGSSPKSKEWWTLKVRCLSKLMHLTFKFIKLQEKKISMLFYFRKYKNSFGDPQIHFTFDKTVFPQDPFSGSSGSFSDIAWSLWAAGTSKAF